MIWYDTIGYGMIWYVCYMICYAMIYDMIRYGMVYDTIWYNMIYYDIYDMILYDMIWYIWYDMIWYIWYDMIWYDMIRYNMIWYDMIRYDMIYMLLYDIYDMICLLIAIGLTPGGSSTVHIYTQTIHRTTQWNRIYRTELM